jgi:putative oxidoreductase
MFDKLIRTDENWAVFVARITVGLVMLPHGMQKMFGWFDGAGFGGTLGYFDTIGIPAVFAVLVIFAEFFGSLGLIFGFLSRIAAAGIALDMIGAIFKVHLIFGFFMNWWGLRAGEGYEFHLLVIGLCVVVILAGSGKLSVDAALAKKRAAA